MVKVVLEYEGSCFLALCCTALLLQDLSCQDQRRDNQNLRVVCLLAFPSSPGVKTVGDFSILWSWSDTGRM